MRVETHFTLLVYSFHHAVSERERGVHLQRLNSRWQPWWRRLDDAALKCALDDTYFFLPYIREMLFPETRHLPSGDASQQIEKASQLARLSADELAEKLDPDGVVRLTYDSEQLEALHPLQLEFERKDEQGKTAEHFCASIRVSWVDMALFPQNIGFLILKVGLGEQDLTINRINDFLYYLRQVHPPAIGWQLVSWRCNKRKAPPIFESRDLVDFLLQGLIDGPGELDPTIATFLGRLCQASSSWRYSAMEAGQVYG